ncbi:hypothetical protein BGZ65_010402 [Modicella reniformis]|uniref:Uncharacterized protein n=1 Tax=Modicella reniformis TaxID=1440133 RepID=A0A9P6IMP5_9FUNG|nr:hypothetical protein BGZ65_010402 [Modicella reniformis]
MEPTVSFRGKPSKHSGSSSSKANSANSKGGTKPQSLDYNLDPAIHCPNLLHLTDAWCEVDENSIIADEDSQQGSLFKTSVVVRYDRQQEALLVKTSNRILALLHYHPRLQTFRWIGASSEAHMGRLGRYLLTRQHQLVELQLQQLRSSIPELNRIIANCPWLRRLHLDSLILDTRSSWPDLVTTTTTATLLPISAATPPSHVDDHIIDLGRIETLTLENPYFPLIQCHIYGPALLRLHLSDCCSPAEINNSSQQLNPLDSISIPPTPESGVYWDCPQLQTYRHEGSTSSYIFVYNLLDSCRDTLRSLAAINYTFDPDFVVGLKTRGHCQLLTHLDFSNSTWIKSTEIQLLLCYCPELIEFTGPQSVLWGEDLTQSALSWSCLKLKKLQQLVCLARPDSEMWVQGMKQGQIDEPLTFPLQRILGSGYSASRLFNIGYSTNSVEAEKENIGSQTSTDQIQLRDVQDAIYGQLSRLTQLEVLDLAGGGSASLHFLVEYPLGIPWTLEAGLDKLKGLSRVRKLVVTGWEDKMTRKEVRWLKQYWPELHSIENKGSNSTSSACDDKKQDEDKVVGWLAFKICLEQDWPDRFPDHKHSSIETREAS